MKKLIAVILVSILVFAAFASFADFSVYPMAGRVFAFNAQNDEVFILDGAGNIWCFLGIEDWQIDDLVACIVWNAGTEEICDDEIIDVAYAGEV